MKLNRRHFLNTAGILGAAPLAGGSAPIALQAAETNAKRRTKLAVATYSYWHFRTDKVPIETVIDKAAALGVEGIDVLHRQMEIGEHDPITAEHRSYCRNLKRRAFSNGMSIVCLSTHQNFLSPDAAKRDLAIEHTKKCLEIASEMGAGCMRINAGSWGTIPDFDELMKARGVEPILPGHTEDEGFNWCIDGIEKCLSKAEECGVVLALENHWGLSRTPEGQLRILNAIKSPWLGALMDTGNFLENPYDKLKQIAPRAVYVQAKTYYGGGEWYTLDLDYPRIAGILAAAGYTGWVGLEMEGKEDPETAVKKSVELLRSAFDRPEKA
ncbi:MAG TPA: sugar phosphate isomerase/epimerase family protein [Verrucomicrobiae bacterium]